MLESGGRKSSLLTMLSFTLDIHVEMSSRQELPEIVLRGQGCYVRHLLGATSGAFKLT